MVKKNNTKKIIGISAGPIIITSILVIIFLPDLVSGITTSIDQRFSDLGEKTQQSLEIAQSDGVITDEELAMIENEFIDESNKIIIENLTKSKITDDLPIISLLTTETFALESNIIVSDSLGNQISTTTIATQFQPQSLITQAEDIIDLGNLNIKIDAFIPDSKINEDSPPTYVFDGKLKVLFNGVPIETKTIFNDGLFIKNPETILIADSRTSPFSERQEDFTFQFSEIQQELIGSGVHLFSLELSDLEASVVSQGIEERFVALNNTQIYRLEIQLDQSKIVELNEQGEIIFIPRADGKIIACGSAISGGNSGPQTIVPFPTTTFSANDEIFLTIETFPPIVPTQASNGGPTCKFVTGIPRNTDIVVNMDDGKFILNVQTPTYQRNYIIYCLYFGYGNTDCNLFQSLDPNVTNFWTNEQAESTISVYQQLGFFIGD